MAALSSDEWVWDDVGDQVAASTGVVGHVAGLRRSRAASMAVNDALDAESWMTPPPVPLST
ncbi:MAG: hypothetical protein R2851_27015 [Caldilineaceae bacterium]